MKSKYLFLLGTSLCCLFNAVNTAHGQGTAFTYQGRLNNNGLPASGKYDLRFTIYDSGGGPTVVAGPVTNSAAAVSNGLFAVTLDFGAGVFSGPARWLDIAVRTNGNGAFAALNPRQALTPSPYAIFANTASNVVSGSVVKSLNNLKDNVTLAAGANVTVTPSGNTLTIASAGAGGSGIWSVLNNNAYYTAGNVGIGTSTPAHRLSLGGGPTWTDNGWAGAVELANGAAIGWQANQGGQRFGMGHSYGGFYLFRTASNPGTTGSPALYDFVVDDSGNVGIGTITPTAGVRLEVVGATRLTTGGSGGAIGFGSPNAETGMSISGVNRADVRFDGSTLKLLAGTGVGPPSSLNGIAISTNGNVGIGKASPTFKLDVLSDTTTAVVGRSTAISGIGVYGESTEFSGVQGLGHNANHAALVGVHDGGGVAVYGTGASGVQGDASSAGGYGGYFRNTAGGVAVHAEGNATQARDKGGFVKAMAYIDPFLPAAQYVVRSYNSQGTTITVTRTGPGNYLIDFGFKVDDRFISVTPGFNGLTISANNQPGFNNVISVNFAQSEEGPALVYEDTRFFIFVY